MVFLLCIGRSAASDLQGREGLVTLSVISIDRVTRRLVIPAAVMILAVLAGGVSVLSLVFEELAQMLDPVLPGQAPVHQPMREGILAPTLGVQACMLLRLAVVLLLVLHVELLVLERMLLAPLLMVLRMVVGRVILLRECRRRQAEYGRRARNSYPFHPGHELPPCSF